MTVSTHADLMALHRYVLDALLDKMAERDIHRDGWIRNEQLAMAIACNDWTNANRCGVRVSVDDVERLEVAALGHSDYATKAALYVAEHALGMGR